MYYKTHQFSFISKICTQSKIPKKLKTQSQYTTDTQLICLFIFNNKSTEIKSLSFRLIQKKLQFGSGKAYLD